MGRSRTAGIHCPSRSELGAAFEDRLFGGDSESHPIQSVEAAENGGPAVRRRQVDAEKPAFPWRGKKA
jgi:hypothetical protein